MAQLEGATGRVAELLVPSELIDDEKWFYPSRLKHFSASLTVRYGALSEETAGSLTVRSSLIFRISRTP